MHTEGVLQSAGGLNGGCHLTQWKEIPDYNWLGWRGKAGGRAGAVRKHVGGRGRGEDREKDSGQEIL